MAPRAPAKPVAPKLLRSSTETSLDMRIVLNVALVLDAPKLNVTFDIDEVPLRGAWSLKIKRVGDEVTFHIKHGELPEGALGTDLDVQIVLEQQHDTGYSVVAKRQWAQDVFPSLDPATEEPFDGYSLHVPTSSFALRRAPEKSIKSARPSEYRFTFEMRASDRVSAAHLAKRLGQVSADVNNQPFPHDVRIFFPSLDGRPAAELWTSEAILKALSPYFRTLFSSGFAETIRVWSKRVRPRLGGVVKPVAQASKDFDDSDDETDRHVLGTQASLHESNARVDPKIRYKQVTVTQAAYSTYRAVLLYLSTGYIHFAPLTSSFATSPTSRIEALEVEHKKNPHLPFPASPKSVYRLAHILELDNLEQAAMRFFHDECLNLGTAPIELFSDLSRDHTEWRRMILERIMAQWDEVKASEVWATTTQRIKDGEIEGAGPTMVELLEAIAKRKAVKP